MDQYNRLDLKHKKNEYFLYSFHYLNYAEDRNRTGTEITLRRILSPVRLPVPPPRLELKAEDGVRTRDPHLGKVVFYH